MSKPSPAQHSLIIPHSFQIDHTKLQRGLYLQQVQTLSSTTLRYYDIRLVNPKGYQQATSRPFRPLNILVLHALEHLLAFHLRQRLPRNIVTVSVYGCQTGLLLITNDLPSEKLFPTFLESLTYILKHVQDLPSNSELRCGNPINPILYQTSVSLEVTRILFPYLKQLYRYHQPSDSTLSYPTDWLLPT